MKHVGKTDTQVIIELGQSYKEAREELEASDETVRRLSKELMQAPSAENLRQAELTIAHLRGEVRGLRFGVVRSVQTEGDLKERMLCAVLKYQWKQTPHEGNHMMVVLSSRVLEVLDGT